MQNLALGGLLTEEISGGELDSFVHGIHEVRCAGEFEDCEAMTLRQG